MDEAAAVARALPWQDSEWQRLRAAADAGQLPHALLLEGAPGTGRGHFATALGRLLLCGAPTPAGNCGTCRACELSAAGTHPDHRQLEAAEAGKAIGVDRVRAVIDFAAGKASLGNRKVVTVNPTERLTTAAFNAFLKCLEEPSPGTFLLLVHARGQPLPATIRSRCQRWSLPMPTLVEAREWLAENASDSTAGEGRDALLSLAGGRPLLALAMGESADGETLMELHAALGRLAESAPVKDLPGTTAHLDALGSRLDAQLVLDCLEMHTRAWLRRQAPVVLRSRRGHDALRALDEFAQLRAAQRAGSNPNADLLRHRALVATMAALAGDAAA